MQAGVAVTDPDPLYHAEGLTMFDPTPEPYDPESHTLIKAARFLGNLMRSSQGLCTDLCKVSQPNRSRSFYRPLSNCI